MAEHQEEKSISDKIDESYGYEDQEEEEQDKSIAQQMIEAIKAKRDAVYRKGRKAGV